MVAAFSLLTGTTLRACSRVFGTYTFFFESDSEPLNTRYELILESMWRFESAERILVGLDDYDEPTSHADMTEALKEIFGAFDRESFMSSSGNLVVESVAVDVFGGFSVCFPNHLKLSAFPAGRTSMEWILRRKISMDGDPNAVNKNSLTLYRSELTGDFEDDESPPNN
jgi:hypothetical protein